jgi:deazaflavin-dependent oxidoreductase (nitroreductase family)
MGEGASAGGSDKSRYDARMGLLLRSVTRLHRILYRISGGRLGRRFPGGAVVVWITSLGRKSGQWRRNPLLGAPDKQFATERGLVVPPWIVAGSNAGQEQVPGWVHNVRAQTHGWVEVDGKHHRAVFEEILDEAEHERCYGLLIGIWRSYESYQQVIQREIPVFRIHVGERVDRDSLPTIG